MVFAGVDCLRSCTVCCFTLCCDKPDNTHTDISKIWMWKGQPNCWFSITLDWCTSLNEHISQVSFFFHRCKTDIPILLASTQLRREKKRKCLILVAFFHNCVELFKSFFFALCRLLWFSHKTIYSTQCWATHVLTIMLHHVFLLNFTFAAVHIFNTFRFFSAKCEIITI